MAEAKKAKRVRPILAQVKSLSGEYYRLTGKLLGVTREVAKYVAAETLGLELAPRAPNQLDCLKLELPCKLPSLHNSRPVPC